MSRKFFPLCNRLYLCKTITDFQNYFTAGKSIKFATKLIQYSAHPLCMCCTTLGNWMSELLILPDKTTYTLNHVWQEMNQFMADDWVDVNTVTEVAYVYTTCLYAWSKMILPLVNCIHHNAVVSALSNAQQSLLLFVSDVHLRLINSLVDDISFVAVCTADWGWGCLQKTDLVE